MGSNSEEVRGPGHNARTHSPRTARLGRAFEAVLLGFRPCSATYSGKLLYVSVPQFLHLLNEDKINSIYLLGLLWT